MLRTLPRGSMMSLQPYRVLALLTAVAVTCSSEMAWGQQNDPSLPPLPENSDLIIVIRAPFAVAEDLAQFVDSVAFGYGADAQQFVLAGLDALLQGRTVRGLKEDGTLVFVVENARTSGAQPPTFVFAEVSDYEAFRESVGGSPDEPGVQTESLKGGVEKVTRGNRTLYFARIGETWTAVARDEDLLRRAIGGELPKLELTPSQRRALGAADVAIILNVPRLWERFQAEIEPLRQQVMLAMQLAAGQGVTDQQMQVIEGLLNLPDHVRSVLVAASVSSSDVTLDLVAVPKPDSPFAQFLAQEVESVTPDLSILPQGAAIYTGISLGRDFFLEYAMQQVLSSLTPVAAPGSNREKVVTAFRESGIHYLVTASSFGANSFWQIHLMPCRKPERLLQLLRDLYSQLARDEELARKSYLKSARHEKEAVTYRGIAFDRFSAEFDLEALGRAFPGLQGVPDLAQNVLGAGVQQFAGRTKDATLIVTARDEEVLRKAVDAVAGGEATLADFDQVMKVIRALGNRADLLFVIDVGYLIRASMRMIFPDLPEPEEPHAYAGGAIRVEPDALVFRAYGTAETLREYVGTILTLRQPEAAGVE